MNITLPLALKLMGSLVTFSSPLIYLWLNSKDSITGWDYALMKKINSLKENKSTITAENTTATISSEDTNLKITTTKEASSNTFTFELKLTNSNEAQEIKWGMKYWECKLKGSGLDSKITQLKESFGIETSSIELREEHKISLIRFISSCARKGNPWRPKRLSTNGTKNNKLSREVDVDSSSIENFYYNSHK